MKTLIIYYSKTGHTLDAARDIAEGMKENQVIPEIRNYIEMKYRDLGNYDLILVGSPCHAGSTAPLRSGIARPLERFLKSIPRNFLQGKKAAAFSVNAGLGAGNTVRSLEKLLKRAGALVVYSPGPAVKAGAPLSLWRGPDYNSRDREKLRSFGKQVASNK
ncbi:MAG: flavodoxin domain-containing protein [Proteobacteria bacterium]|jgi:flavodoxin|nr:flavodoxin domain-containing protein [Pseudomonadota bacterium]